MIRILQHGCLPPRCQIWTDMFHQVREVDMDDTHARTDAPSPIPPPPHTHTHICSQVQRSFSRQAHSSRHTRQLSRAEKWENVLLSEEAVSHTAVQNQQLSVQRSKGQSPFIQLLFICQL